MTKREGMTIENWKKNRYPAFHYTSLYLVRTAASAFKTDRPWLIMIRAIYGGWKTSKDQTGFPEISQDLPVLL